MNSPENVRIILETEECKQIIQEILDDAKLDKLKAAVGIEFHNPCKIITLCTWSKSIYLFDLLTNPSLLTEGRFGELLEAEHVLKVANLFKTKFNDIYHHYGVKTMPLYDTCIVYLMDGPLNRKGKPIEFILYRDLCKNFDIETPKFPQEKHLQPPTIRPLQEEQVRKYASQVEHLMSIMQKQLADKNAEEKPKIITMICEKYINEINQIDQTDDQSKDTKTNDGVTVIVENEICKRIVQEIFDDANNDVTKAVVGFDCEGVDLGRTGKLTLVQISTWKNDIFLFDVLTNPGLLTEGKLGDLLQSDRILKESTDFSNYGEIDGITPINIKMFKIELKEQQEFNAMEVNYAIEITTKQIKQLAHLDVLTELEIRLDQACAEYDSDY